MSVSYQQEYTLFPNSEDGDIVVEIKLSKQKSMKVPMPRIHQLVIGAENIDWNQLFKELEPILYKGINKALGRHLDLRAHCGIYLLQSMHNWTDRFSEEMIRYYAPARIFCGYAIDSTKSIDHTRIEKFRNRLGKEGAVLMNKYLLMQARKRNYTNGKHVDMDTAVQEAGITHPTEMKLMKKFQERVINLAKKITDTSSEKVKDLKEKGKKIQKLIKEYQFFTKTKEKRKELINNVREISLELLCELKGLSLMKKATSLRPFLQNEMNHLLKVMPELLDQIKYWLNTGEVAKDKILSLYKDIPKFISKGKIGKKSEIGRKWIINQLTGGFLLLQCPENPSIADTNCVKISLQDSIRTFGEKPESYGADRGMYSQKNIKRTKKYGIIHIGIQPKGQKEWEVDREMAQKLYCRRAGIEPRIGIAGRLGLKKSRAKTDDGDIITGFRAGLGFNLKKFMVCLAQ